MTTKGNDGGASDRSRGVGVEVGEEFFIGSFSEDHDAAVTDDDVLVGVLLEKGDGGSEGGFVSVVGEGEGGEGGDAG